MVQLLWTFVTYLSKDVEHGIEHDIDGTYEVCIHQTFIPELNSRFDEYLAI